MRSHIINRSFSCSTKHRADNNQPNDEETRIQERVQLSREIIAEADENVYENEYDYIARAKNIGTLMSEASSSNPEVHEKVEQERLQAENAVPETGGIGINNIMARQYDSIEFNAKEQKPLVDLYVNSMSQVMHHTSRMLDIVAESNVEVSQETKDSCKSSHEHMVDSLEDTKANARDIKDSLDEYYNAMGEKHRNEYSDHSDESVKSGSSDSDSVSSPSASKGSLLDDYADTSTEPADYIGGDD